MAEDEVEEDEYGFDREQIEPVVKKVVDDLLLKETFDEARTQLWIDLICERVLGGLAALSLPMKYIGTNRSKISPLMS